MSYTKIQVHELNGNNFVWWIRISPVSLSIGQSVKLLLDLASTGILGFRACQDLTKIFFLLDVRVWEMGPLQRGEGSVFLWRRYVCCTVVLAQGYLCCHCVQVPVGTVHPLSLQYSKIYLDNTYRGFLSMQAYAGDQSHVTTDGLSWCRALPGGQDQIFVTVRRLSRWPLLYSPVMDWTENTASGSSSVVACVSFAMEMCLLCRCPVTAVSSGSAIQPFKCRVKILKTTPHISLWQWNTSSDKRLSTC